MSKEEIKELVFRIASESARRGPGWSQEGVVLREVSDRVQAPETNLAVEQTILDAWHDLFTEKKLGWGYDLDNPNSPFFHVR